MAPPNKPQIARNLADTGWDPRLVLDALSEYGPKGTEGLNVGLDAVAKDVGGFTPSRGPLRYPPVGPSIPGLPDVPGYGRQAPGSRSLSRAAELTDNMLSMDVPRGALEGVGKRMAPVAKKFGKYAGPAGMALGAGAAIAGSDRPTEETLMDLLMGPLGAEGVGMGDRGKEAQMMRDQASEFQSYMAHGAGNPERAGGMSGDSDLGGFMGPERPAKRVTPESFGAGKKGTRVRPTVPNLEKIDPFMEMLSAPLPTAGEIAGEGDEMDILSQLQASDKPMFQRVNGRVPRIPKAVDDMIARPLPRPSGGYIRD